jgi:hypothetical protein
MATESKINGVGNLVPDNTIAIVTEHDQYKASVSIVLESLKGKIKRDWMMNHAYHCLPLVIGNQYGFAIKSLYDVSIIWNGGQSPSDTNVVISNDDEFKGHQFISSHFGGGIVTVQNRFHFRTPLGVNLMTINPPNMFIPHIHNLTGVVETDNLRRDFTFNLKVTTPNVEIVIKKGDVISGLLPIQRFFVDNFNVVMADELFSSDVIEEERLMGSKFAKERTTEDIHKLHGNGRRYWKGEDADGNQFHEHQRKLI